MQYIQYGNAGIQVSRLCFGAMNFYEHTDQAGADRIVAEAVDAGINFFDTADAYGLGKSEEILGRSLKPYRDRMVIATKLWASMDKTEINSRGTGRYYMMREVEASLKRLGTDRIDLYQLHHPDAKAPVEETLSTLDTLVKQGKIRYVGVSNHYAWQMAHMLGVSALHNWEPLVSVQCHYNLFNRSMEHELAHFCRRFNIAAITYGPLSGGLLSGKIHRNDEPSENSRVARHGLERIAKIPPGRTPGQHAEHLYNSLEIFEAIAEKYQIGLNQLAVKWVLSRDWVTCPILGGSRAEHFSPMYRLFDFEIEEADLQQLEEVSLPNRYVPFENQAVVGGALAAMNRI